mmetsp:Transcript_1493/g.1961  ORF Transcript_1493/g.1961 Transcript_1493/m.1961 type:complete len:205 (-) Transcript_1493:24-638(-)
MKRNVMNWAGIHKVQFVKVVSHQLFRRCCSRSPSLPSTAKMYPKMTGMKRGANTAWSAAMRVTAPAVVCDTKTLFRTPYQTWRVGPMIIPPMIPIFSNRCQLNLSLCSIASCAKTSPMATIKAELIAFVNSGYSLSQCSYCSKKVFFCFPCWPCSSCRWCCFCSSSRLLELNERVGRKTADFKLPPGMKGLSLKAVADDTGSTV